MDQALYSDGGGDVGLPFCTGDSGRRIEYGNGSGFMTITFFAIDGPDAGKRHDRGASGLDRLTQGRLIVLELDDQMRIRGGGGFEGFFDNASRRR